MNIDIKKIDLENIDFDFLRKELMKCHYEYKAFSKSHLFHLKVFSFVFSLLVAFNFYSIVTDLKSDEISSVIVKLVLVVFNTFMATNSFTRIKYEKLKIEMEEKDYNKLMYEMNRFEKERGNENE